MNNKTLLLDYGCEGGGSSVSKFTVNGEDRIFHFSFYDDFLDDELSGSGSMEYNSFEAFWENFVKDEHWFKLSPMFIHDDCKNMIGISLNKINLTGLSDFALDRIERWKNILSK